MPVLEVESSSWCGSMSAEEVNRLLDYNLSLGSHPGPGVPFASPLSGVNSQGTFSSDSF